jgi:hypothetical protein
MKTTAIYEDYEEALRQIAWLSETNSVIEDIASSVLLETGVFYTENENQLELFTD